ncbi:DsbA family protein [Leptospira sp. GIMC2001]|uniref:DsbA family protein n=1 Tax=Leptospira sp. GIMC2001 TaxID=1513297 RepID=UPI00234ADFD7|nr:thioredoxin domain-containing protein [Leptospira sp. GIMC2001]WCL50295.1 thioredoxin domain-containing protein [Leptospira sp. GIMC2001]
MQENNNPWIQSVQGKTAIGIAALFVVYLAASLPAMIGFFSPSDSVQIDGTTYTLEKIKGENPALYNRYLTEKANLSKEILGEFTEKKILDIAMKEAGVDSPEAVLKKGFAASEPSDSEMLVIYNQYKAQLGGRSFPEAKDMIRKNLVGNSERQHAQTVQRELIKKYNVAMNVQDPPTIRHEVPEGDNPSIGSKNAKVTIIEFSDFECPFCKRSQDVNKRLREKYKDKIRWVFRDFPLDFHENAMYAHAAANCAIPQDKYWEFFDILFENSGNLGKGNVDYLATKAGLDKGKYQECMSKEESLVAEIRSDMSEGQKFGVTGTPAFFINGIFVSGALPFENFDEIIKKELD